MKIAKVVADRSTCCRAKVGCVLVDTETNTIVATGYNGSVKEAPHCEDVGCLLVNGHCKRTIHAELNAVLHLERRYSKLNLYSTHQPCLECYKALVSANVNMMYYLEPYKDEVRDKLDKEIHGFLDHMVQVKL